jgi:hypothetical protein
MPRLNQNPHGKYYVTHRFQAGPEEVIRNYNLTEEGEESLLRMGHQPGDTIKTNLFHELRIQGHIFSGNPPLHPPAEVVHQQNLTQMVSIFFEAFDAGEMAPDEAAETFGRHILSQIPMVSHALRRDMLVSIADKIQDRLERNENTNVEVEALRVLRQKILESAPSNVAGTLRMIFHL